MTYSEPFRVFPPTPEEILAAGDDIIAEIADDAVHIEAPLFTPIDEGDLLETVRWVRYGPSLYALLAGGEFGRTKFVHYADLVHEGLGIHAGNPRPFLEWAWEAALSGYQSREREFSHSPFQTLTDPFTGTETTTAGLLSRQFVESPTGGVRFRGEGGRFRSLDQFGEEILDPLVD